MPAVPATVMVSRLADAFLDGGGSGVLLSRRDRNPREFGVTFAGRAIAVWAYVWTVTPGGRRSLPHELRIQMTSVTAPLRANPNGPTLLLGYEPSRGVFAGFDFERHREFTEGSPSIQIHQDVLTEAATNGIAFGRKDNGEVVVGVRPDLLLFYAEHARELHRGAASGRTLRLLERAAAGRHVRRSDLDRLPPPRQRLVRSVESFQRSCTFREAVLRAYDHRCAVTGMQLRLVDAAHVLPVAAPGSTDDVTNGVALAPTYHRAYDAGLIYFGKDYVMRVNESRAAELDAMERAGGLAEFRATVGCQLLLPPEIGSRPRRQFIEQANRFRRIGS